MSEERFDRIEKRLDVMHGDFIDLTKIVVGMKTYMEENLVTKDELKDELKNFATKIDFTGLEERLNGKIEGVQRSVDGAYERHTALETRVTKLETTSHT